MPVESIHLPSELKSDIKNRLKTLSGQIQGIVKMLDEGKDPERVNVQFKSVTKGIQKAHFLLLDEVYRKALALGIVNADAACPGDCGQEDRIVGLKTEFPDISLDELIDKLKEIQMIERTLTSEEKKK